MKAAAIISGPAPHIDHLGVLANLLDVPCIVTDTHALKIGKTFYPPSFSISLESLKKLSLPYLAEHFDVLWNSSRFFMPELDFLFQALHKKKMRFVCTPHGNSDKTFSLNSEQFHPFQDIRLVYGQHMRDLLDRTGAAKKTAFILSTGNYRLRFYQEHKEFYDNLVDREIFFRIDRGKKTILYAPTWREKENSSSFFDHCENLIQTLPSFYNLIIKLHPLLDDRYPSEVHYILEKYKRHPGLLFLTEFPSIYPLLDAIDIYLGDFSSIGYDCLALDKPLFFLLSNQLFDLHKCGMAVPADENPYTFIEKNLEYNISHFAEARRKLCDYTFDRMQTVEILKKEIEEVLLRGSGEISRSFS